MTTKVRDLLNEAIRRWLLFGDGKSLETSWTGLGYPSEYKPVIEAGLMEWIRPPKKRCMGWLRLTSKGTEVVRQILRVKLIHPVHNVVV